jgi:hypothetical protein
VLWGAKLHWVCELSFVLLGELCEFLVDESRFGFANHYIKGTVDQLGMCFWCNACDLKHALYPTGVRPNQILLWRQAQSGLMGMGKLLQ